MANFLVRHGSPSYGDNLYEDYLYGGLGQREFDLSESAKQAIFESNNKQTYTKIYHSPANVCVQTAEILSQKLNIETRIMHDLYHVKHDFSKFTNVSLWVDGKAPNDHTEMNKLRKSSITHFLEDKLSDPKQQTLERFSRLEKLLRECENALFVSHGYTLKLFYLYLKTSFRVSQQELISIAQVDQSFGESLQGFVYPNLDMFVL